MLIVGIVAAVWGGYGAWNSFKKPADMQEKLIAPETRNDLVGKIRSGDLNNLDKYVDDGLDPNQQLGSNGQTLLIIAAQSGNFASVKHLIKIGADPKKPDRTGMTPITAARMKGHEEIAKYIESVTQ